MVNVRDDFGSPHFKKSPNLFRRLSRKGCLSFSLSTYNVSREWVSNYAHQVRPHDAFSQQLFSTHPSIIMKHNHEENHNKPSDHQQTTLIINSQTHWISLALSSHFLATIRQTKIIRAILGLLWPSTRSRGTCPSWFAESLVLFEGPRFARRNAAALVVVLVMVMMVNIMAGSGWCLWLIWLISMN